MAINKESNGYTIIFATIMVVLVGGILAFLSLSLKDIPVGIAYAMWSAIGIVLVSIVGYFLYDQKIDLPAMVGIGLIIIGVVVMNLFSKSVSH